MPPQTAEQWELGTKTEFFDGRMPVGFAYFDLTRKNMSVPDPHNPNLSRAIGVRIPRHSAGAVGAKRRWVEVAGEILLGKWRDQD